MGNLKSTEKKNTTPEIQLEKRHPSGSYFNRHASQLQLGTLILFVQVVPPKRIRLLLAASRLQEAPE